jgi:hypothetical protein
MTLFLAIISGALMTELSTNFLLSHALVNRVAVEATDSSAIEFSLSKLQGTQLNAPCPVLSPASLNNLTAAATYQSCWPDVREPARFSTVGVSNQPFNLDGTQVLSNGVRDYVVGDAAANLFDYRFGSTTPRWTLALGGALTSPPLVIPDGTRLVDILPASGAVCSPSTYCIDVRLDSNSGSPPPELCRIPTTSAVTSEPGASITHTGFVHYWDGASIRTGDFSGGDCDLVAAATVSGTVVAGPQAFRCGGCNNTEDVYAVTTDGTSSQLLWYTYSNNKLAASGSPQPLLWANVVGIAASGTTLPASLAITFANGGIELVRLASGGAMSPAASYSVAAGIADAADWCGSPCGNLIGVGGQNGRFYLFDSSLNPLASYGGIGSSINTTPVADGAGNWYVGADDGYVHELQVQGGNSIHEVESYGQMARVGSSLQLASCPSGICIYLGGLDDSIYLIPLDARDVVISACISTSPPSCSGANPRLWAQVEVGAAGSPQAVHVQGWSYYSA